MLPLRNTPMQLHVILRTLYFTRIEQQHILRKGITIWRWPTPRRLSKQTQSLSRPIIDLGKSSTSGNYLTCLHIQYSHAHYSLGSYESAASAFQRGLDLEPGNANLKAGKENALARIASDIPAAEPSTAPRGAEGLGGGGGGGGGGGFDDVLRSLGAGGGPGGSGPGGFDLASMMQNPAIMNMAQQMMQSGGLENLMRNPAVNNMVRI